MRQLKRVKKLGGDLRNHTILKSILGIFKKFFHGLLSEGIYIAPSAYETWFITDALTYEDLDFTINAIDKVSRTL